MVFWGGGNVATWQIVLMGIGMVIFWIVVVWLGLFLYRSATTNTPNSDAGQSSRRILDERLARGEVDADEYSMIRSALVEVPSTVAGPGSSR